MAADDPFHNVDPLLAARVKKMIADSGGRLWVTPAGGWRDPATQIRLWNEAVKRYGSEAAARKWVAKPGSSNHEHGLAIDISGTPEGKEWMARNHGKYGLWQPMEWEPWHMQLPPGTETEIDPDAYTEPPIGFEPVGSATDPYFQAAQLLGILDQEFSPLTTAGGVDIAASQSPGIDLSPGHGQVNIPDDPRMANYGFDEPADLTPEQEEVSLGARDE